MNKRRRYKAKRLRRIKKLNSDAQGTLIEQHLRFKVKMHSFNYGMSSESFKALLQYSFDLEVPKDHLTRVGIIDG